MEELIPVLKSLKMAKTVLCGESDVSFSLVYPVTTTLLSKHLLQSAGEPHKVTRVQVHSVRVIEKAHGP